jgi:aspartate aminotransferase
MVTTYGSPLSFLQQRLRYVAEHPDRDWTILVDNVPTWQGTSRPDITEAPAAPLGDPFRYAECEGIPELIEAVVLAARRDQHTSISTDNVLVTNGAMHAISLIAGHCRHRGTRAFVQRPVVSAVPKLLADHGYSITYFDATIAGIAAAGLRGSLLPNTGIIYLNSPNNPTGQVVGPGVLESLVATASASGAALICDHVYDTFGPSGARTPTALPVAPHNTAVFYVNSMSKNYGAPGLRIGWIVATPSNTEDLAGRLERENVAVTSLSQAAAAAMLVWGNEALQIAVAESRRHLIHHVARSDLLSCCCDASGFGGCSVVVDVPVDDIEAFADRLLVDYAVAVTTPSNFAGMGDGDQSWIRMPLGYPADVIVRALGRIEAAAVEFASDALMESDR